jgi:hypothetical protein
MAATFATSRVALNDDTRDYCTVARRRAQGNRIVTAHRLTLSPDVI